MSSGMTPGAPGWNPNWTPGPNVGPMTVGRLLDRIWTILRGHYKLFVRLGLLPAAATLVVCGVMFGCFAAAGIFHSPPTQPPDVQRVLWIVFPATLILMVPLMVAFSVYQAATCDAAIAVNRGLEPPCGDLNRRAWSKAGRYTWLVVLHWLIVVAPMYAGMALFGLAGVLAGRSGTDVSVNPGGWFVLIPFIFLLYVGGFVYMIWMLLRLGLAFPACVTEDLTAWQAVKRSNRLTVKAKGRMFLVMLVVYAVSYAAILVFELVGMAVVGILLLIGSAFHMQIAQPVSIALLVVIGIVFMAVICLMSVLMWAAYAISLSVIYEDQVLRIGPPVNPALAGGGTI